jgi:hypothetical protein
MSSTTPFMLVSTSDKSLIDNNRVGVATTLREASLGASMAAIAKTTSNKPIICAYRALARKGDAILSSGDASKSCNSVALTAFPELQNSMADICDVTNVLVDASGQNSAITQT